MRSGSKRGFSLVETLVGVGLLVIVGVGVYGGFAAIAKGAGVARLRNGALALANERLEIVRGMDYADVGVVNGVPAGKIPHVQTFTRGVDYQVTTTVRSIDLPFDGTIGGTPNDTSPADQKLVEIAVTCARCGDEPLVVSTRVSPEGLELSAGTGAIFVQVVDAAGQPLEDVDVLIQGTKSSTTVSDRTGADGFLRLVGVATGTAAYSISVSKDGYSSARTYPPGGATNPVPTQPDVNVTAGAVTQVTFAIDHFATVSGTAVKSDCSPVSGFDFSLFGQKQIGLDTYKYDADYQTNGSGDFGPVTVEWDGYSAEPIDTAWTLAGTNPPQPFSVAPDADAFVQMIVASKSVKGLLVKVLDAGTGLPVAGSSVTLSRTGWTSTKTTGYGSAAQTDWSGGPGVAAVSGDDPTKFWASDGHVAYSGSAAGTVTLSKTGSNYATSGWLESSTFDTGTTTKLVALSWLPGDQPKTVGTNALRFQLAGLATTTASSTWSYVGPGGTSATYFTTPGQAIPAALDGLRYFRYKAYLSTASTKATPTLSDVLLTYTLGCAPAGQAFFSGLAASNSYTVAVTASGYQAKTVTPQKVQNDWQELTVALSK